jgi:hypothetical protein
MSIVRPSQALARVVFGVSLAVVPVLAATAPCAYAQAPASPVRVSGTIKSINGTTLSVTKADGTTVSVPVAADAAIVQLPPGVTDIKTAQPIKFSDIVVSDRVVTGKPGETDTASRVIVIKAGDIAAKQKAEQADWQKRGVSGLVKSVSGSTVIVTSGAKMVTVDVTPKTVYRRYAPDSIQFQDAVPGQFAQIQAGDQISVRGDKSDDGSKVSAEEVVSGTFANLSGLLTAVDASAGTVTFKDLTSKKTVTVKLTANSDVRSLPATMAASFAARNSGGPAAGGDAAGVAPAGGGGGYQGRQGGGAGGPGGPGGPGGGGRARAGMDLSRMLARLPKETVADLKPKDAVMIVASPNSGADSFTAITLLSGVEPLLTAPAGAAPITLSPWSIGAPGGGGGPE